MKKKDFSISILVLFTVFLLFSSCRPGDKKETIVRKAEKALEHFYAENPSYSVYAINVLRTIDHPFSRALIHKALKSKDWDIEYAAMIAAAEMRDATSIPLLQKIYEEGKGAAKLQAALSLARLGVGETISYLKDNAISKGETLNKEVIEFLAEQGDESFLPALKEKLSSKEITERNEVYAILGKIKSSWSLSMLKGALKREWGSNRKEVINAIGQIGGPSEAKLIVPYINIQDLSLPTMFALGNLKNKDYVKNLKKYLKHKKKYARLYAAVALWRMDDQRGIKAIEQLFNETDPTFRGKLAEQLCRIEDDRVLSYLATLSDDQEERVRKIVIRNLRDRKDPSLMKILLGRINDPSYEVAVLAIEGLGWIGNREILGDLEPLLENENGYIAISAAASILHITSRHPLQQ